MKKKRIIPIVLFKDGFVVQSKNFSEYRNLGNPFDSVRRLSDWGADEVAFINIGSAGEIPNTRNDLGRKSLPNYLEVLSSVSETAHMPLSSGGQIRSLSDISTRLSRGADKVIINTASFETPEFLSEAIRVFGSQCITVSMDVRKTEEKYSVFINGGSKRVDGEVIDWIKRFGSIGVGELLFTCIDRDGSKQGFDLVAVEMAAANTQMPLIVCGGAGKWEDFETALNFPGVDAVAAANIFQHTDQSVYLAHQYLYNKGAAVRKPQLL
jgi:cyclase